jgi:acyl-CoA dehydrogenase
MLRLPFFDEAHRELAAKVEAFARERIDPLVSVADTDTLSVGRKVISEAATAGLLHVFVGAGGPPELRALCIARETIAARSALADSVLAVNGLGTLPILRAAADGPAREYATLAAQGRAIGAFALTEPGAGSDPSSIETTARRDGAEYVLDGTKTFISNAGLASFYIVFARTSPQGSRSLSTFVVGADAPGFRVSRQIPVMAPHPLGEIVLDKCRVSAKQRLGNDGDGMKIALSTLDFFRSSVGAAACGMAARALDEALSYAQSRRQFGSSIVDFQATRMSLADMGTELDAARLLVYRAAWLADRGRDRVTREASMAKLFATEAAQRIVDRAVQLHGGIGVTRGAVVERLYRDVRALRIYEGTSEIQRLVIAAQMLNRTTDTPG